MIISSVFFALSLAVIFFHSNGHWIGSNESSWALAGIFMFVALGTFLKAVFSEKRMHDESHHSLP